MSPIVHTSPPRDSSVSGQFRTARHVFATRHADTTVLLDARQGVSYTLNELGWRIWDQIGAGESVPSIVRTLRQEYDVPRDTFDADVVAFVEHLLETSLIERVKL